MGEPPIHVKWTAEDLTRVLSEIERNAEERGRRWAIEALQEAHRGGYRDWVQAEWNRGQPLRPWVDGWLRDAADYLESLSPAASPSAPLVIADAATDDGRSAASSDQPIGERGVHFPAAGLPASVSGVEDPPEEVSGP
jgi:hypothetical protein